LRALNVATCDCGRDFAPDPTRGAYNAPPVPLADVKREGQGKEGKGRGRKREESGMKKGEVPVIWNRAADCLRPTLRPLADWSVTL